MTGVAAHDPRMDELLRRLDLATWWAKVAALSATALFLMQFAPVLIGLVLDVAT